MRTPLILALVVSAGGCVAARHPIHREPVHSVEGIVTYKGEPMTGARIAFHPLEGRQGTAPSVGKADSGGVFRMTTYDKDDGVPAGEYAVTVYWPERLPVRQPHGEEDEDDEGELQPPDRLRLNYATKSTTRLRAVVHAEANVIDFHLP
ncbi:MAG: hypothetical protein AB7K24_23630 [Gemmataceae bacterium]